MRFLLPLTWEDRLRAANEDAEGIEHVEDAREQLLKTLEQLQKIACMTEEFERALIACVAVLEELYPSDPAVVAARELLRSFKKEEWLR